jgi:hypothetical protein
MIVVGGSVANCPTVNSLSMAPSELDVGGGGTAVLVATATVPAGGTPTFSWSAPSGILGPNEAMTTFQCTVVGDVVITVTATFDGCSGDLTGVMTCLAPDGG